MHSILSRIQCKTDEIVRFVIKFFFFFVFVWCFGNYMELPSMGIQWPPFYASFTHSISNRFKFMNWFKTRTIYNLSDFDSSEFWSWQLLSFSNLIGRPIWKIHRLKYNLVFISFCVIFFFISLDFVTITRKKMW